MFLLVSGKISEITWLFFFLKNFKPKKDVPTTCPKHKSQESQEMFEHKGVHGEMKPVQTKPKEGGEEHVTLGQRGARAASPGSPPY